MDEKWDKIYAKPLQVNLPPVAPTVTPRVNKPNCLQHCTGNHHPEGVLRCMKCQTIAYKVIAHEWLYQEGHYFYSIESMNGAPVDKLLEVCTCGGRLVRQL